MENKYRKLINMALEMPPYEPPKHEPVKQPPLKRLKEVLTMPLTRKVVAESAYDLFLAVGATGTFPIADRVPVSQLHRRHCLELNRLVAEAALRGGLPMTIHFIDRFESFIDFGHARVLHLYTQIHHQTNSESLASFIVKETRELPKEAEIFTP